MRTGLTGKLLPHRAAPLLATLALLAGCAVPRLPIPIPVPTPSPRPAPEPQAKPAPIPTRPINVSAQCSTKDETGYVTNMRLAVSDAQVHQFDVRVEIPRRGTCRFSLADFRQTQRMPIVLLKANNGSACVVQMWEQGRRVTVGFQGCEEMCSPGSAFDHLWPILADSADGTCG